MRHDFLLDRHGELTEQARMLPEIRDNINDLPQTTATFKVTRIHPGQSHYLDDTELEFLGGWPIHESYSGGSNWGRGFVNPNYIHARTYTDMIHECECGGIVTVKQDNTDRKLDAEGHKEDCRPHMRLQTRAEMTRERWQQIQRLAALGWNSTQISTRFGAGNSYVGSFIKQYDTTFKELRNEYRQAAGEMYRHLVHEQDESAEFVSELYGHSTSTLGEWARTDLLTQ